MKHIARICLCIATLMLGGSFLLAPLAYGSDQTFSGKLVCSSKCPVALPVDASIISLNVQPGQKVKAGEILGRYQLTEETRASLNELTTPQINDMRSRMAEIDKGLYTLENKKDALFQLVKQNLAPSQSLKQVNEEIETLRKQRALLADGLGQVERKKKEEVTQLHNQLNVPLKLGHDVPKEGVLKAPMDGHVLWMHPDLRPGAWINKGTSVMMIGVMNPMLLRALVYESEALKLKMGEEAVITLESLPGRKFTARLSRIAWAPSAVSLENPTYYEVEFEVANPDLVLREGMKATVTMLQSKGKP
jgi:macrolide-specific efflux system membrane fusion protein